MNLQKRRDCQVTENQTTAVAVSTVETTSETEPTVATSTPLNSTLAICSSHALPSPAVTGTSISSIEAGKQVRYYRYSIFVHLLC